MMSMKALGYLVPCLTNKRVCDSLNYCMMWKLIALILAKMIRVKYVGGVTNLLVGKTRDKVT